jgi:hypothetical protein
MTDPDRSYEQIPGSVKLIDLFGGVSLWRWAVVTTSLTVFLLSLTCTAYVTPDPYSSTETTNNSAFEQLAVGWIGVPVAVLSLFLPYPYALASLLVSVVLATMKWRGGAIVAAVLSIGVMLAQGTLSFAAWLANPLLAIAWIYLLVGRRHLPLILGLTALGLMLSALQIDRVPAGLKMADVPIIAWTTGYWLWVASAVLFVLGVFGGMLLVRFEGMQIRPELETRPLE